MADSRPAFPPSFPCLSSLLLSLSFPTSPLPPTSLLPSSSFSFHLFPSSLPFPSLFPTPFPFPFPFSFPSCLSFLWGWEVLLSSHTQLPLLNLFGRGKEEAKVGFSLQIFYSQTKRRVWNTSPAQYAALLDPSGQNSYPLVSQAAYNCFLPFVLLFSSIS